MQYLALVISHTVGSSSTAHSAAVPSAGVTFEKRIRASRLEKASTVQRIARVRPSASHPTPTDVVRREFWRCTISSPATIFASPILYVWSRFCGLSRLAELVAGAPRPSVEVTLCK